MAAISKAEYLKRYMMSDSVAETETKKKKKKKIKAGVKQVQNIKIHDDEVDFKSLLPQNLHNTLDEDIGDNDPTVADIIDERPDELKRLEEYRNENRWKSLQNKPKKRHDSSGSDTAIGIKPIYEKNKNTDFKNKRHDSDSDVSPPRKTKRNDSDSDESPPRRTKRRNDSDSDESPPRRTKRRNDSDESPPRRSKRQNDSDESPPRRTKRWNDSDESPPRRNKRRNDSDKSPPRRTKRWNDSDESPPRRNKHRNDSDESPPRRTKRWNDSDESPPRRNKRRNDSDESRPRRTKRWNDSDESPPRRNKRRNDSDESPPRKKKSPSRKQRITKSRWDPESDSDSGNDDKMKKTLGGAKAGLSSAKAMREEMAILKNRADEAFKKVSSNLLGKDAKAVVRKGRKTEAEKDKEIKDAIYKKELNEKYQVWGKGIKQAEQLQNRMESDIHEMNKPLARYEDDEDRDSLLKAQARDGDPMLAFLKTKKSKGPTKKELPKYKGRAPPPNRFNLWPGYRWDGVDRSNGFEKLIFAKKTERKAREEEAYKWSVEDM